MAKQYVATIMNRIYLGEDNYIFYPSFTDIGKVDEETKLFVDRNGREFLPITNEKLLSSEISEGYCNLEELYKLPQITGNGSVKDAVADYDYYFSSCIYYVSLTQDGIVFSLPINLSSIKTNLEDAVESIKNGTFNVDDLKPDNEEDNSAFNNLSDPELGDDLRNAFASFFAKLLEGKYSLDDLKILRDEIIEKRDDIDSLIDSIDLQIEATEYGESSVKLKKEEKVPKKTRVFESKTPSNYNNIKNYLNINEMYDKITKTLIAQDEPLRRVLTEIARKEQSDLNNDRGILITGSTGTGKTKMMELIARNLDRPFLKVDSTQLTVPGYVGKDIEEVLWDLYIKCGRDVKKAERAIIFFDEIDKKGSSKKDDISGKGVLNVLLPFFDGATYDACENMKTQKEIVKINTKNMLVILGGAFEDVYGDLKNKRGIGFLATSTPFSLYRQADTQDFIEKAKMPAEFMGRVAIVKLNELELNDIKRILLESDESALKIQEQLFESLGVKLTSGEDYINAIAEQAMSRKTGARGLNTVVDESTWEAYGDVYTHLGLYDEIILGKETVEDPKVYKKIYKKK